MPKEDAKLILIVDDETRMRRFIKMNLDLEGYRVIEASNGLEALDRVREDLPDLALLDVMMPELDGFEALRIIRETSAVPVIMLTVRDDEDDKVRGLELGADDYVTKPFSARELNSRIKAVLRRTELDNPDSSSMVVVDDYLQIDFGKRQVFVGGEGGQIASHRIPAAVSPGEECRSGDDSRNDSQQSMGLRVPRRKPICPALHYLSATED
jgi:two-component system KDP operon response regulator KdpE